MPTIDAEGEGNASSAAPKSQGGAPRKGSGRHGGAAWARALCWIGTVGFDGWEVCVASLLDRTDANGSTTSLLAALRHLDRFGPREPASGGSERRCKGRRQGQGAPASDDDTGARDERLPTQLRALLVARYGEEDGGRKAQREVNGLAAAAAAEAGRGDGGEGARLPMATMPFEPTWVDTSDAIRALHAELRALAHHRAAPSGSDADPSAGPLRIGVDTEWADGPTEGSSPVLAVVQLAIDEQAWVIDALSNDGAESGGGARAALGELLRWMLDEASPSKIMVLGFAFSGDLAVLRPICGGGALSARTLVDVQALAHHPGENTPSLKKVCARALGKGLDKAQQCSEWARRPLAREQFVYAALDAHVLLGLHTALQSRGRGRG